MDRIHIAAAITLATLCFHLGSCKPTPRRCIGDRITIVGQHAYRFSRVFDCADGIAPEVGAVIVGEHDVKPPLPEGMTPMSEPAFTMRIDVGRTARINAVQNRMGELRSMRSASGTAMYTVNRLDGRTDYACTRISWDDRVLPDGKFGCMIIRDLGRGAAVTMQKMLKSDDSHIISGVAEWMENLARSHEVDWSTWGPRALQRECDRVVGPGADEFRRKRCHPPTPDI